MRIGAISPSGEQLAPARRLVMHWIRSQGNGSLFVGAAGKTGGYRRQRLPLSSDQIRAARTLLRWSAEELSRRSLVSLRTIRRAELTEKHTTMTTANDLAVRRALESAGVEFIDENGGWPWSPIPKAEAGARCDNCQATSTS
jgi:hypothetical protein